MMMRVLMIGFAGSVLTTTALFPKALPFVLVALLHGMLLVGFINAIRSS